MGKRKPQSSLAGVRSVLAAFGTIVLATTALAATESAFPAALRVDVRELRTTLGVVEIGVCANRACYEAGAGFVAKARVPATQPIASFDNLPPGQYTILMFHDENANGKFDKGVFGVPLEGFGFSNDVRPRLSRPDYGRVVFEIPTEGRRVVLHMQYLASGS